MVFEDEMMQSCKATKHLYILSGLHMVWVNESERAEEGEG